MTTALGLCLCALRVLSSVCDCVALPNVVCVPAGRRLAFPPCCPLQPCGGAIPLCMVEEFDLPMEIIDRRVTKMKMISPSNR